jgi:hypothetical protein
MRGLRFYSPEARGNKEGAEICGGFGSEKEEGDGVRFWKAPEEEEGKVRRDTDKRDPHVSDSRRNDAAAAERERARDAGPTGRDSGSAQEEKEAAGR